MSDLNDLYNAQYVVLSCEIFGHRVQKFMYNPQKIKFGQQAQRMYSERTIKGYFGTSHQ